MNMNYSIVIIGLVINFLWYVIFMKNAYVKHYTEEGVFDKYESIFPIKVNWLVVTVAISLFSIIGNFLFIVLSLIYYLDLKGKTGNVIMKWDIPGVKVFWTTTIYKPKDIVVSELEKEEQNNEGNNKRG